jgi:putative DNA primase/helicase
MSSGAGGPLSFADLDRLCGGRRGVLDVACPLCGPDRRDPRNRKRKVLRVWRTSPGFTSYNCARCGVKGGARDDTSYGRTGAFRMGAYGAPKHGPAGKPEPHDGAEAEKIARNIDRALRIFDEASDLRGTPGWGYLAKRRVDLDALPARIREALRWHPCCPWGRDGGTRPAVVALFTDAVTGEPRAIHRIAPIGTSEKADKWMLGPSKGCVIRLWPDDEVTNGLVIGEGIETVLCAATRIEHRGTLLQPAWAAGDAGHIAEVPVLAGIEALTLLVDNDGNRKGQDAAAACKARWTAAGCEVVRLVPRITDEDFADIVVKEGS